MNFFVEKSEYAQGVDVRFRESMAPLKKGSRIKKIQMCSEKLAGLRRLNTRV